MTIKELKILLKCIGDVKIITLKGKKLKWNIACQAQKRRLFAKRRTATSIKRPFCGSQMTIFWANEEPKEKVAGNTCL